jgi:hypothetical protein
MHLNHVSRKAAGDDGNESDEEVKRGKMVILLFFFPQICMKALRFNFLNTSLHNMVTINHTIMGLKLSAFFSRNTSLYIIFSIDVFTQKTNEYFHVQSFIEISCLAYFDFKNSYD